MEEPLPGPRAGPKCNEFIFTLRIITYNIGNLEFYHRVVNRFSDRGGGVPHAIFRRVMNYNFTTADQGADTEPAVGGSAFSGMLEQANNISQGPMHG